MPPLHDVTGERYNRLVAIERVGFSKQSRESRWRCLCDCGNETVLNIGSLVSGAVKSCGCIQREARAAKAKPLLGLKFGRLTVIEKTEKRLRGQVIWKCRCDCGLEIEARSFDLTAGLKLSCGCGRYDKTLRRDSKLRARKLVMQNNRRARQISADGTYTVEEIDRLYEKQKGKCANCFKPLGTDFHRDHIVAISKGGSNFITNIQLLCPTCNARKNDKDPFDFARQEGRLL